MSLLAAALSAGLASAAIAPAASPFAVPSPAMSRAHCEQGLGFHRAENSQRGTAKRLGDLPPAKHILAVYREIDRCPAPIIVRTGIGFVPPGGRGDGGVAPGGD